MHRKKLSRVGLLWSLSRGCRRFLILSMCTTVCMVFFNFLTPQIIRFTVDGVLTDQPEALPAFLARLLELMGGGAYLRQNLYLCALLMAGAAALSGLCNYLYRVNLARGADGMMMALRNRLYAHLQQLPYAYHVSAQTGDIIQRCTSDVDMVRNFLSGQLMEVLRTVCLLSVALTLMFSMHTGLSLLALAMMPPILLYSALLFRRIAARFQAADESEGALSATVQENLTGVRVVRAFGRQQEEMKRFDERNELFAELWVKLGTLMSGFWSVGDVLSGLQGLVVLTAGVFTAVSGEISLGEFMTFVTYNSMLVGPIRSLGRILSEMGKTGVAMTRICEILEAELETDPADALTPDMTGTVRFEHVSFAYRGEAKVLRDVSFTVKAGTTCGILGAPGSGKSTLMYLLDRLYDLPEGQGSITVGGVDIRKIHRRHLRSRIGFVLQEPFLYSKTIEENIGIAAKDPTRESVRRAADIGCLDEAVESFQNGYETVVGERGVTLSGGQKQRLAIARTLMRDTDILIFDDSLSAVDAKTDLRIRQALQKNTGDKTVFLISHRLSTLEGADLILVLENGKIVQKGTHESLLAEEGTYRRLYLLQTDRGEEGEGLCRN